MNNNSRKILILMYSLTTMTMTISSDKIESKYLDWIHQNLSDLKSLDFYYRNLLHKTRDHRLIDTVFSPIDLTKIRSNDYNETYLNHSCYETMSDLLLAHGLNKSDLHLSRDDLQSLLPSILYSMENPGCQRRSPSIKTYPFVSLWIGGLIFLILIKLIHLIVFVSLGEHCLSLTSVTLTKTLSNPRESLTQQNRPLPLKYRLWLGLGFNAFTCGLMAGTVIYHLIPHIYAVPDEDFDYMYLLRATVVFFGVYLFFIVEKLLRFRFKIDELQFDVSNHTENGGKNTSDASMIQMARMCGTLHITEEGDHLCQHSTSPARIPLQSINSDDDDEKDSSSQQASIRAQKSPTNYHTHILPHQTRNLLFYHVINDFTNDLIYGFGLCTALVHHPLIGATLVLMILSEGFRRHSQSISQLGRKRGLFFLLLSIVFLLLGYSLCGLFMEINRRQDHFFGFFRTEYVYSIVYGALFYTALVTLIPELNDFGHHLQIILRQSNQTAKQRRLIKTLILLCQNLFLIIGVMIALGLASIWRYYHRRDIYEYVCKKDPLRLFCRS